MIRPLNSRETLSKGFSQGMTPGVPLTDSRSHQSGHYLLPQGVSPYHYGSATAQVREPQRFNPSRYLSCLAGKKTLLPFPPYVYIRVNVRIHKDNLAVLHILCLWYLYVRT